MRTMLYSDFIWVVSALGCMGVIQTLRELEGVLCWSAKEATEQVQCSLKERDANHEEKGGHSSG